MAWFNFGNKKEKKEEARSACLGVIELFSLKTDRLLIIGQLKGTLNIGDCLQVCNPDEGFDSLGSITVESLSDGKKDTQSLTDEHSAQVVVQVSAALKHLKKGSVLYTADISEKQRSSAYTNALYTAFVRIQSGDMTNDDYLRASLEDSIEILRLFLWECKQNQETENEEAYQTNLHKIAHLEEVVRDKLFQADSIYAVYSEATGEPYMFSKTLDRGEEGYLCTDPLIKIMSRRLYEHFEGMLDYPRSQIKKIENGEDKQGIKNFLGSAFYLNGALGVIVNHEEIQIKAQHLVEEPDFSNLPDIQIPVMNPALVRWLLLMGQLGELDTKDKELIYGLYYGFFSRELPTATFLVPMQKGDGFPKDSNEAREITLKQGASFNLPIQNGKNGRQAVSVFTDWKRLRMVFDEEWSGMIEPAGGMIAMFDYAINATHYLKAGCYVNQESFKEMEKLSDEMKNTSNT